MTSRFAGKRVLITGATSGIGLAGARLLAREGAALILTGTNRDRLAALSVEFRSATVLLNDASRPDTGSALVDEFVQLGLDGLWLNAGYADVAPIADVDADLLDKMMATNVRGPILHLASLSGQLTDGAAVVVTSSTSTYEGARSTAVYAATKAALTAAARTPGPWNSHPGNQGEQPRTRRHRHGFPGLHERRDPHHVRVRRTR